MTTSPSDQAAELFYAANSAAARLSTVEARYGHAHDLILAVRQDPASTPTEELHALDAVADGLAAYGVAFEAWRDVQSALIDARRAVAQARQQDGEETRS